jgi:hypothetical protein
VTVIVLKVLAALAFVLGIAVEVAGQHPGGLGFAGNAGAIAAVVLWALSAAPRRHREEGKGR